MPDELTPVPVPTLDELIERSGRLRVQSDQLNQEMRELEALILAAAKARDSLSSLKPGGKAG